MLKYLILSVILRSAQGLVESFDLNPTNSNGVELGELSFMQLLLCLTILLLVVILYGNGVLPVEIDLGEKFFGDYNNEEYIDLERNGGGDGGGDYYYYYYYYGYEGRDFDTTGHKLKVGPSFLLDCPLQFVCEVDEWAHRDHDGLLENLLALWFRNPKKRWRRPEAAAFSGVGSCREMHPCPFDVQDAVGFRIPGAGVTQQDSPAAAFLAAAPSASPYVDAVVTPYSVM